MQVKLKGTHQDLKRQRLLSQSWRISAEQHLEVHLSYLMFHLVLCLTSTPKSNHRPSGHAWWGRDQPNMDSTGDDFDSGKGKNKESCRFDSGEMCPMWCNSRQVTGESDFSLRTQPSGNFMIWYFIIKKILLFMQVIKSQTQFLLKNG